MSNKLQSAILTPESSIREALLALEKSGMGYVFICDSENRFMALGSEGDIRRALLAGDGLSAPVTEHLNKNPTKGYADTHRGELVNMLSSKIHCLPILDKNEKLIDVIFSDVRSSIPIATPTIGEKEIRYVTEAVVSGWVSSQGKFINRFEEDFAAFIGCKHAIAVCNGTVALHLALVARDIGPGDEVIIPALTFAATANAVLHAGAKPVYVDVDRDSWNIDPRKVEAAITPKTKAIIPVHLYGNPVDLESLVNIANKNKLIIIEDAAQAHGAEYKGKRVGGIGEMGCFSFFGNKIMTTGEGGIITTNDDNLNTKLRILRDHGMSPSRRYWHEQVGYNYRMTNLQAAIGVAQIERWQTISEKRSEIESYYNGKLLSNNFRKPLPPPGSKPVMWLYTVAFQTTWTKDRISVFLSKLNEAGIDVRPTFFPLPSMPPYFIKNWETLFKNAYEISERAFSLPSSVELNSNDLAYISNTINKSLAV